MPEKAKKKSFIMKKTDFKLILKYIFQALLIGIAGGLMGCLYNFAEKYVKMAWQSESPLMFSIMMPIVGLVIVFVMSLCKMSKSAGSNDTIKEAAGEEKDIPINFSIAGFFSLLLTDLAETVTGREGASWQLVPPVAKLINKKYFPDTEKRIAISCAIASGFAAIWGLPVFGAFIASEMAFACFRLPAFGPSLLSAIVARLIAKLLFNNTTSYTVGEFEAFTSKNILQLIVLAIAVGILARVLVWFLNKVNQAFSLIKNAYIRIFVGGSITAVLCYFMGKDYLCGVNGIMSNAIAGGETNWYAFLLKILFFAILFKSGYKTGILIQTWSIGALFGAFMGSLLGLPTGLAAAVSLVALFAGTYNCPVAALALVCEIFGYKYLLYCLPAIFIARLVSGNCQIYAGQTIKYKIDFKKAFKIKSE